VVVVGEGDSEIKMFVSVILYEYFEVIGEVWLCVVSDEASSNIPDILS
jgi:hypothetical protein